MASSSKLLVLDDGESIEEIALPLHRKTPAIGPAWVGANVAANDLADTLRAKAVLVLAHDDGREDLRVVGAAPGLHAVGDSVSAEDFMVSTVLVDHRSLVVPLDEVHGRRIVAVPVMAGGRSVGVIAAFDPVGSEGHVVGTIEHVARRLARSLGAASPRVLD